MAIFITANSSNSQEVEGETFLLPGVRLTVSNALAFFEDSNDTGGYLKIDGLVYVSGFFGVATSSDAVAAPDTVVVGSSGSVDVGPVFDAVQMVGHDAHFSNQGAVTGGSALSFIDALFGRIENSGRLEGTGRAAINLADSNSVQIVNDGTILGLTGVRTAFSYAQVLNSGIVRGTAADGAAIDARSASGAMVVRNAGLIEAPVNAYLGGPIGSTLVNSGRVAGDVVFGDGADEFRGAPGKLDGILFAGGGNDRALTGARDDEAYGGGGADTLFGNDGDDALSGGSGADILGGGAGDDQLTGNQANDIFLFPRQGGDDRVTDFLDGSDRLDLTAFRFASVAAVAALAANATGGMVLDLTSLGGGTAFLQGFAKAAFDAGDIIL